MQFYLKTKQKNRNILWSNKGFDYYYPNTVRTLTYSVQMSITKYFKIGSIIMPFQYCIMIVKLKVDNKKWVIFSQVTLQNRLSEYQLRDKSVLYDGVPVSLPQLWPPNSWPKYKQFSYPRWRKSSWTRDIICFTVTHWILRRCMTYECTNSIFENSILYWIKSSNDWKKITSTMKNRISNSPIHKMSYVELDLQVLGVENWAILQQCIRLRSANPQHTKHSASTRWSIFCTRRQRQGLL